MEGAFWGKHRSRSLRMWTSSLKVKASVDVCITGRGQARVQKATVFNLRCLGVAHISHSMHKVFIRSSPQVLEMDWIQSHTTSHVRNLKVFKFSTFKVNFRLLKSQCLLLPLVLLQSASSCPGQEAAISEKTGKPLGGGTNLPTPDIGGTEDRAMTTEQLMQHKFTASPFPPTAFSVDTSYRK